MSDNKVITLICERACDLSAVTDSDGQVRELSGLSVVKLPCSGMIQPNMISAALKSGAAGVIVTGCQIGDCYYREGNRMIRDRLLGNRPPGLKKDVDRRRVLALWLARPQKDRFLSEAKDFMHVVRGLGETTPAPAAKQPDPKVKAAEVKPDLVAVEGGKADAAAAQTSKAIQTNASDNADAADKAKAEGDPKADT